MKETWNEHVPIAESSFAAQITSAQNPAVDGSE